LWFQIISQGLSLNVYEWTTAKLVAESARRYGVDNWKNLLDILTGYMRGKNK